MQNDGKYVCIDNKADLKQQERKWLEADDNSSCENDSDCEAGRGKRKKMAKTYSYDKEEPKDDVVSNKIVTKVAKKKNKVFNFTLLQKASY